MADEDEAISANNNDYDEVFVYMGGEMVVPDDVVRAQVHPSVTVIPDKAFQYHQQLEEIELCEGLIEIGKQSFCLCKSLKHISIPSTVTTIPSLTFQSCNGLEEVELCEGLIEIGNNAFWFCESLKHVNIPSTVKTIGSHAFCGAPLLTLHLPNSIESIGNNAFCFGRFHTVRVPPLVTTIATRMFSNCCSIFSVELPETITQLVAVEQEEGQNIGGVFDNCRSLRNVAVPPHADVGVNTFKRCTDLLQLFGSQAQIINALKHRFDNLPIHKMVYYHSYNNLTSEQLSNTINIASSQTRSHGNLNPTGNQQDCLGMTPLHILTCSKVQNIELYQVLIEKYPDNLITEDRWGALPLLYAVWVGNEPSEIVQLLVEKYLSIYPSYELDWTSMITTLGERSAPENSIKSLLDLQKVSFSAQKIDWDKILNTVVNVVDTGSSTANASLKRTFLFLVKVSTATRVDAIGIKLWRDDMVKMMIESIFRRFTKQQFLDKVKSKLHQYETEYHNLKEATAFLELALWKTKLGESNGQNQGETRYSKKRKIEDLDFRNQCRVNCSADFVIEHVLLYLLPTT